MMRQKQLNIYGVVGHNFGDEAIAVAASNEIRSLLPSAKISVTSSRQLGLQERYGIGEIRNDRRSLGGVLELVRSVRQADLVLIGGGTLIQDKLGLSLLRGNLAYALHIALLATLFRRPVCTLAIGVDELQTKRGRTFARWFLRLMDFVLVRDDVSLQLARSFGNDKDLEWFAGSDPAFLLETDEASTIRVLRFENYLVLSLVNEGINWAPFLDSLSASVSALLEADIIEGIVLLAMDDRESEELSVFEAWLSSYPNLRDATEIIVPLDAHDAASIIRKAKLMVAARLHAMILGLGSVPFLAISRTTKTANFLEYAAARGIEPEDKISGGELTVLLTSVLEDSTAFALQQHILQDLKRRARTGIRELIERARGF